MSSDPASGSILNPPSWLRGPLAWYSIIIALAAIFGGILSIAIGHEKGIVLGSAAAMLLAVLIFACQFAIASRDWVAPAIKILENPTYTKAEEKTKALAGLKRWMRLTVAIPIASVLVIFLLGVYSSPAIWNFFKNSKPHEMHFASLTYYMPSSTPQLLEESPFLEAVIASLREEGTAEGGKFRIVMGETKPLTHPTPPFQCKMDIGSAKEGNYTAVGYAFRRRAGERGTIYEPVPLVENNGSSVFSLPAMQTGDVLFVVLRIAPLGGDGFPDNPTSIARLAVTE